MDPLRRRHELQETVALAPQLQRRRLGAGDCERFHDGCVAQPVNSATSLGYLLGAAVVLARARRPCAAGARSYAAILALVGLGSVAYHGPQPSGAQVVHDAPIVALIGQIALTPAVRKLRGVPTLPGWSRPRVAVLAVLSAASCASYAAGRTGARTCDPDSLLQLHGLWHLLSGAAFIVGADILYRPIGPVGVHL